LRVPQNESTYTIMVEWGDCDPAGIVYYPAYYRWMDQATFRMFRAAGLTRDHLVNGQWTEGTPLVETKCAFKRASEHGEQLTVRSHISRWGTASFTVSHVFVNEAGEVAAEGYEIRIWARKDGDARTLKSVPIPDGVRRALGG
jgi:4-hydroxybenzoyl-CoA thioesterase